MNLMKKCIINSTLKKCSLTIYIKVTKVGKQLLNCFQQTLQITTHVIQNNT